MSTSTISSLSTSNSMSILQISSFSWIFLLFSTILIPSVPAMDVFCGRLTVYEQQRFGRGSFAISSQMTTDLKQCLELCCGILNCDGVTFMGIITARASEEPNCLLVGCHHSSPTSEASCDLTERVDDSEGLISVTLARNVTTTHSPQPIVQVQNNDTDGAVPTAWIATDSSVSQPTTGKNLSSNDSSASRPASQDSHTLAPVWAVGLAIVIAVVCVGLNLSLLSAYICYRRKQSRKQTAQISTIKGPTLHAYNPTL